MSMLSLGGGERGIGVWVDAADADLLLSTLQMATSPTRLIAWEAATLPEHFHKRAEARFVAEGDDASGRWAALSDYTILDRIRLGYGDGPILLRTGALEAFVTGDAGNVSIEGDTAAWTWPGVAGSPDVQIAFEATQGGTTYQPERKPVAMNATDLDEVLVLLETYIIEQMAFSTFGGSVVSMMGLGAG